MGTNVDKTDPSHPELIWNTALISAAVAPRSTCLGPPINLNGRTWLTAPFPLSIYGYVTERTWIVTGPAVDLTLPGNGPADMLPFDFFMWIFPTSHLLQIKCATNQVFVSKWNKLTSAGEILWFLAYAYWSRDSNVRTAGLSGLLLQALCVFYLYNSGRECHAICC